MATMCDFSNCPSGNPLFRRSLSYFVPLKNLQFGEPKVHYNLRILAASFVLLSHAAWAIDWGEIHIGVDENNFYFNVVVTDVPDTATDAQFTLRTKNNIIVLEDNQEQFLVDVNLVVGEILDGARLEPIGTPTTDHWLNEAVPEFRLMRITDGSWQFIGSIPHGNQPYQPGDHLGEIRLGHSGGSLSWTGYLVAAQPPPSLSVTKTSETRLATTAGQVVTYVYEIRNTGQVVLHDVSLTDDNVDKLPFCDFDDVDELTVAPHPAFTVTCSARHTVTAQEIEEDETLDNTTTVTSDEAETVMTSLSIPFGIFSGGFENPENVITVLDDNNVNQSNAIAIGSDGFPVISYVIHNSDENRNTLKVAKCNNALCTAASITIIDDTSDVYWNSIAVDDDGLPVISYFDDTVKVLKVAKCNDAACTGGDEAISTVDDPEKSAGRWPSIAIGEDDLPVISYGDATASKLNVAKCDDAACSGGDESITVINDPADITGWHTSIAIGSDGFPVISYHEIINPWLSTLKVAKCNDTACAGEDETISVVADSAGTIYASISISIGTDGLPVLAYRDPDMSSIFVARCNDAACSGNDETVNAVDSAVGTGELSLAVGADDFPVISFRENSALKVVKCNNATCSNGEVIRTIVDDLHYVGEGASIAIGGDGLPIISYLDSSAQALKVIHCGTPSCQ